MVRHLSSPLFSMVLAGVVSAGCGSCSASSVTPPDASEPEVANEEVAPEWDDTPQDPLTDTEKDKIKQLIEQARENFEKGQDFLFSNRFTNDGKITPPQAAAVVGKSNISAFARKSPKITSLAVSDIEIEGAGKHAIVTATVAMMGLTNDPEDNNALTVPVSVSCSLLVTLRKNNNGRWRAKNVACPALSP